MARFKVTPEMVGWLKVYYPKLSLPALTQAFNHRFGLDKSEAQLRSTLKNHGVTCGRAPSQRKHNPRRLFDAAERQQITAWYQRFSAAEVHELVVSQLGRSVTLKQLKAYFKNNGITCGRSGQFAPGSQPWNTGTKGVMKPNSGNFAKGQRPLNYRPIGSERINRDGYIEVKVADPNQWRHKQRLVWEQAFGPIPEGKLVRFKDGDPLNLDPANLFLVDRREHVLLSKRYQYKQQPAEVRESVVLLAKVDVATARAAEKS